MNIQEGTTKDEYNNFQRYISTMTIPIHQHQKSHGDEFYLKFVLIKYIYIYLVQYEVRYAVKNERETRKASNMKFVFRFVDSHRIRKE